MEIFILIQRETKDSFVVVPEQYSIDHFVLSEQEAIDACTKLNIKLGWKDFQLENGIPIEYSLDEHEDDEPSWFEWQKVGQYKE